MVSIFRKKKRLDNEHGVVAIFVSMIMAIVITLVVLGFSLLTRADSRQAIDHQLSIEAFDAASSGINNAISIIENDLANGQQITEQLGHCGKDDLGVNTYNNNYTLTPAGSNSPVEYTCVNVNTSPTTVQESIAQGSYYAFPVLASSSATTPINSISITWSSDTSTSSLTSCPPLGNFPAGSSWPTSCSPSELQIDLIAAQASQTLAGNESNAYTIFVSPQSAGIAQNGSLNQGAASVYSALCSTTGSSSSCTVNIDTAAIGSANEYYVRVMPLYGDISMTASADGDQPLYDVQADIDVTGEAQDELQRLDARVPLSNLGGVPYAVQTGDSLCKQLEGYPGYEQASPESVCDN